MKRRKKSAQEQNKIEYNKNNNNIPINNVAYVVQNEYQKNAIRRELAKLNGDFQRCG